VHRWFDVPPLCELPFMIITVDVREEHRSALPAITHINGSARVQTVGARDNQEFHTLLCAVGRATGREMVLNTSFNVKGQPIVNTPGEALDTFLGTGIDTLFLENTMVSRRDELSRARRGGSPRAVFETNGRSGDFPTA
jgi:carbamoyltransferase